MAYPYFDIFILRIVSRLSIRKGGDLRKTMALLLKGGNIAVLLAPLGQPFTHWKNYISSSVTLRFTYLNHLV
jgi:hypothetical protein